MAQDENEQLLLRLCLEQGDCLFEVIKFLEYSEQYYLLFFLSISSEFSENEIISANLNLFGFELIKKRIEIYKKSTHLIENILKENIQVNNCNWIVDLNNYKKLLKFYKNLSEIDMEKCKENVNYLMDELKLIGLEYSKSKRTFFHIYRKFIIFEKELLERSLFSYKVDQSLNTPSLSGDIPSDIYMDIGIIGYPNTGKTSFLFNYCGNSFKDNNKKRRLFNSTAYFSNIELCTVNSFVRYQSLTLSETQQVDQHEIQHPFHTIGLIFKSSTIDDLLNDDELFERIILQTLRKLVMSFPLTPIHIIVSAYKKSISEEDYINLKRKLENFPHLVKIGFCSLFQSGVVSVFEQLHQSALVFKYQKVKERNLCIIE